MAEAVQLSLLDEPDDGLSWDEWFRSLPPLSAYPSGGGEQARQSTALTPAQSGVSPPDRGSRMRARESARQAPRRRFGISEKAA